MCSLYNIRLMQKHGSIIYRNNYINYIVLTVFKNSYILNSKYINVADQNISYFFWINIKQKVGLLFKCINRKYKQNFQNISKIEL